MSHFQRNAALAALGLAVCDAAEVRAAGFMIREGSAAALGAALAGRTSGDADVSYAIHNPAALRGVGRFEASLGAAGLFPNGEAVVGDGGEVPVTFAPGLTVPFTGRADPNENAVVPSLALGWRATDALVLGLAVDSSFGLANEYDRDFIGTFDGFRSDMLTLTVTPMAAYDPTPGFTLAAGVMIQYADAELSSRVGPAPDDIADLTGDGVELGLTLGALVEVTPTTTVGANFQSGFSHKLEGEFSVNYPGFGGNDGSASFDLPAIVSVGLTQEITDDFRIMAEGEWAGWSSFERITIIDEETGNVALEDPQNYENSFMVALGGEYDLTERLTVRAGVAYDQTPTSDDFRTVRVPDGDRYWLAAGFSYEVTERVGLDLGYTYIDFEDRSVRLSSQASQALGIAGTRIDYEDSFVHVIAANLRYGF